MANIIFNVAAKIFIQFNPVNISMIREQTNNQTVSVTYSQGTGQTLTAGQVLYTTGTVGQPGYVLITSSGNTTILGTGSFNVDITAIPTSTVVDGSITFQIDQSNVVINVDYNSLPETSDIYNNIDNRNEYVFVTTDFTDAYSDFDPDAIVEVKADTNITNYWYNSGTVATPLWINYSGQWLTMTQIGEGRLKYIGADQNAAYLDTTPWYAKDSQGNISL